jgi:serine/threonine-protein kinase
MGLLDKFFGPKTKKVDVRKRFELLREAISGTMSSFYMARDRSSGQIVGLKILDPLKTKQLEARFPGIPKPTEGEIASKFNHPYIVQTLEFGTTDRGEQYLVMEFLDGPGLNSLVVGRNVKLAGKRLKLLIEAAEALAIVHRAGYIHRDICPRNFVVSQDLSSLKLIDFGLTLPCEPPFTNPGNRTGTANYMAPEVVRRKPTDQRLDIFSFGVTAYEVCTFELPWPRGDGKEAMSHGVSDPTSIFEYYPHLNQRLGQLIMQCMEADPKQRPQSMDQLLKTIKTVPKETA